MAQQKFTTIKNAISAEAIIAGQNLFTMAIEARCEFQAQKDPENTGIQDKLKAVHKSLHGETAMRVMLACDTNLEFPASSANEGSGYNIYAMQKLADLVAALDSGIIKNAVNNAVMRSIFAFKNAGEKFTGEMARASVSDKIRVQGQIAKLLVRHTASAATAPTQSSSTIQALQTLGVITNTGTRREPIYELTSAPQAKRFAEILAKAA